MQAPLVVDLGRIAYQPAYAEQVRRVEEVVEARSAGRDHPGYILVVEHDPVITVTRRPKVASHLLATPDLLARHGIALAETDRGGDVTYHGPGQVVVYPIVDLQRRRLNLHAYMRLLEQSVIDACAVFGVRGLRDPSATGVWVNPPASRDDPAVAPGAGKIAAMGVRVRKWVTLHGLSFNVDVDLAHFAMIVPCGLAGRPVTSLKVLLGDRAPTFDAAKREIVGRLVALLPEAR